MYKFINNRIRRLMRTFGDELIEDRTTRHYFYLKDEENREALIEFAIDHDFKIEGIGHYDGKEFPFCVIISRIDPLTPVYFDKLIKDLSARATELNGEYDGWETEIILD